MVITTNDQPEAYHLCAPPIARSRRALKIFIAVKLTLLFLTATLLTANAEGISQTMSLRVQKHPLSKVLAEVEKQTGFVFFYNEYELERARPVTILARKLPLKEFLDQIFKEQPLKYRIEDKTIFVMPRVSGGAALPVVPVPAEEPVQIDISGTLLNADTKEPIGSASVVVKNTQVGTTTDANGRFVLANVPEDAVLSISSVGFVPFEISVPRLKAMSPGTSVSIMQSMLRKTGANAIILELSPSMSSLDEVEVVVGYGTVRKSDLTGSVASIKGADMDAFPAANVMQALSGRASGVQVKQNTGAPGAAVSVRVRGTNSIQGSNEPLYVIDGFPSNGNPLVLNNADIESIEILKDASAIAIYGSRGANGVVLINTKSGKSGKMMVDFETSYGTQQLRKKLDLLNAREYAEFYNMKRENDGLAPFFSESDISSFGEGFDWQDFVYQKAPVQNHSLNISAGTQKTRFSLSGSVFDQEGIIRNSGYKRYSVRANIHHTISDKFKASFSTTLTRADHLQQNSSGGRFGFSLVSASLVAPPTLTPYNEDGSYRVLATAYPFLSEGLTNPLNFINETKERRVSDLVLANASLSYEPVKGLVFKVYGGIESDNSRNDYYKTLQFFNSTGEARVSTSRFSSLLTENTVSYSRDINAKNRISVVAGFTFQDFVTTGFSATATGFLSDAVETYNLAAAAIPGIPSTSYSKSALISYLTRVNYSFDDRILATLSFRSDGSSKYSEGNKWGYFPSAAVAYKFHEIRAITNSVISDLKLRVSWGRAGSQAIGAYATLNQLVAGRVVFGDALYNTFAPGTRLPGNLKWETTEQSDLGVDFGLFNNRIQITADYYNKITNDLLNTVQLPSSLGFTNTIQNVGKIRNRGVELSVNSYIFDRDFKWNLNGNISFNQSRVLKLYDGQDIRGGRVDMLIFADDVNLLREGHPAGVFFGFVEDGYNDEGKIIYKDVNGDGNVNLLDRTIIGDPNPDFIYGLNSFMSYKGIELVVFVQGSQGNDLVNISKVGNTLHYFWGTNMLREVYEDHWTPSKTNAKYPRIVGNQTLNFSDRFIEDGSFLRVRNIEVAYNLPTARWNMAWVRNAKIYVSGQNLITLTKYSWWDPEVNSAGGENSIAQGIDFTTYPTSKSIVFGIRLGL